MGVTFEWDPKKADRNVQKHGVGFEEATSVFADPLSITISDPDHSELEVRLISLGMSNARRLIVVVHTEKRNHLRLISAREASRTERKFYEEGK